MLRNKRLLYDNQYLWYHLYHVIQRARLHEARRREFEFIAGRMIFATSGRTLGSLDPKWVPFSSSGGS